MSDVAPSRLSRGPCQRAARWNEGRGTRTRHSIAARLRDGRVCNDAERLAGAAHRHQWQMPTFAPRNGPRSPQAALRASEQRTASACKPGLHR